MINTEIPTKLTKKKEKYLQYPKFIIAVMKLI